MRSSQTVCRCTRHRSYWAWIPSWCFKLASTPASNCQGTGLTCGNVTWPALRDINGTEIECGMHTLEYPPLQCLAQRGVLQPVHHRPFDLGQL